jgi:purine nucleosidase
MSTPVLLDTDIGSDIDDAICLAYLLAQPECELLGITTVTGEARKRAMLASALCSAAGKEVPIFPGVEQPLLVPQRQPQAPQAAALARWDHHSEFPRGQAIEFMYHTILERPGEVVLLTIGPLTNVALLFAVHPEIPSLLRALVMMCGVFSNRMAGVGPREWNARLDPHATAIVYRAAPPAHRSVGLDVTCQVRMPAEEARRRFASGLLEPVRDFAEVWFQKNSEITFHDPLAAATIFDPQICGFEAGRVEVELTSPRLQGLTFWEPGGDEARHEVASTVDPARFLAHFFSVF